MSNPTPPQIMRNLYAKLENLEKKLNESGDSYIQNQIPTPANSQGITKPGSPEELHSNGSIDMKKTYNNVVERISKININDPHLSNYSSNSNSSPTLYQDSDYINHSSLKSDSFRVRGSYSDKEPDYNSLKFNQYAARTAQSPPPVLNNSLLQSPRYINRGEDDTINYDTTFENDIPKLPVNNLVAFQQQQASLERISSPTNPPYMLSPEATAALYNEINIPSIDEYGNNISEYKHQSGNLVGREYYSNSRPIAGVGNSFEFNGDFEGIERSRSNTTGEMNESFSDSKSFLAAVAEIDMEFDSSILKGKNPKYMKDLVNSGNFHKGGNLTICTNFLFNKKKTLFYALTTHRLYAFKEDRSDAELIAHYTIDRDTKVSKAGVYSGVRNFELSTTKNGSKQREIHEFECNSKEEKDEWIHSISKVIQLHKYIDKTLPPPPAGSGSNESYTSTLKTPKLNPVYPTPNLSPDITQSGSNNSFNGNIIGSPSNQFNKIDPTLLVQNGGGNFGAYINNSLRNSPQPLMISSNPNRPVIASDSPRLRASQIPLSSSPLNYRQPNIPPISQGNTRLPPIQQIRNPGSPRMNYTRSPRVGN